MSSAILAVKTISITASLVAAGALTGFTFFDMPILQAQPGDRSLPALRWFFSRGSHIFPQAAFVATAGFAYLGFTALPAGRPLSQILQLTGNGTIANAFFLAAALNIAIAPYTGLVMIPVANFEIIELNERKGGKRSAKSANIKARGDGSAKDSVAGRGQAGEFTDLSGPQTQTKQPLSEAEEKRAQELLKIFAGHNFVRAILLGAGGVVGLVAALAG